jgi:hypothetical protein
MSFLLITSKFIVQTEPEFLTAEVERNEQAGHTYWDI